MYTYFHTGDSLVSKWEGLEQTAVRIERVRIWTDLVIHPHSPGPPEHIHEGFDENFEVARGRLSVLVNGEKRILYAGESLFIPAGTPHKPFNESD